jgi:zinc and cadmium transporter
MSSLQWIVVMSVAGGLVSVVAAAVLTRSAGMKAVQLLVSYAIGAMLGAVFLDILPHALEDGGNVHLTTATVLGGIFGFFLLEKLVLWRHCHATHCEVHETHPVEHDHGRSGMMVLIGDTFHNFVDGILIAAAFLQSTELGIVASLAIIAHEVPQELGDFVILLHSGFSRRRALLFNALSGVATVVGGVLAYFFLSSMQSLVPTVLALAAASMIYVAVADLIPGLHKRTDLRATLQQALLIGLGVASIWLVGEIVGGHL